MMEQPPKEEQKQAPQPLETNIPLDSPLEVSRENTVVPASSPTFLRKPMSPYSGVLANSVKFEDEGWFYDWKRFFMNYEAGVRPEGIVRLDAMGNNVYYMELDSGKSCYVSFATSIATREGDILKATIVFRGQQHEIEIDANTLELITEVPSDLSITVDNKIETNREQVRLFIAAYNPIDPDTGQWLNRFTVQFPSLTIKDYKGKDLAWFDDLDYYMETGTHYIFGKDSNAQHPSFEVNKATGAVGPSGVYKKYDDGVFGVAQTVQYIGKVTISFMKGVVDVAYGEDVVSSDEDKIKVVAVNRSVNEKALLILVETESGQEQCILLESKLTSAGYETYAPNIFYNAISNDVLDTVRSKYPEWDSIPDEVLSASSNEIVSIVSTPITGNDTDGHFAGLDITLYTEEVVALAFPVFGVEDTVIESISAEDSPMTTLYSSKKSEDRSNDTDWLYLITFPPMLARFGITFPRGTDFNVDKKGWFTPGDPNYKTPWAFSDIESIGPLVVDESWGDVADLNHYSVEITFMNAFTFWNYGLYVTALPLDLVDRLGVFSSVVKQGYFGNILTVDNGGTVLTFKNDSGSWSVTTPDWALDSVGDTLSPYRPDNQVVTLNAIGTFHPNEPLMYGGIRSTSYSWIVTVDGIEYSINKEYTSAYRWYSEDIRTRQTSLLRTYQPQETEYTVCESYWCGDKDKDVWVVNDTTCIVIHFTDRISLWKKTGKKDVFKTYEWKEAAFRQLSDYKFYRRYGISCAINTVPYIWELNYEGGAFIIRYREAPTQNLNSLGTAYTVRVPIAGSVMQVPCGNPNSQSQLNQLNPYFTPEELYNIARISATRVGNQLWIGIACDKVLKQWTIKCNGNSIAGIVYGFGHVGIDGTLTGCVIPQQYVNTSIGVTFSQGLKSVEATVSRSGVPSGDNATTSTNDNMKMGSGSVLYHNSCVYFIADFSALVVALEKGSRAVIVPAYQSFRELCKLGNGTTHILPKHNEDRVVPILDQDMDEEVDSGNGSLNPFAQVSVNGVIGETWRYKEVTGWNITGHAGWRKTLKNNTIKIEDAMIIAIGTSAGAHSEVCASSWKSMNDVQKSEPERSLYAQQTNKIPHLNDKVLAAFTKESGFGAPTNVNFIDFIPDILRSGQEIGTDVLEEEDTSSSMGDRLGSDSGVQRAVIRLSDFYGIGQGSYYYPAPGLIQVQSIKQGMLNAASSYIVKAEQNGRGVLREWKTYRWDFDEIYFILDYVHNMDITRTRKIRDDNVDFSTGQYQSSFGRSLSYRKYGYAHRYINYPTENIQSHTLKDFTVSIENTGSKVIGETQVAQMYVQLYESKATQVTSTINDRISIVQGSDLDSTALSNAKRSYKGSGTPQFSAPNVYDYCVYKDNQIFYTAADGEIVYVSIKDTKVLDGPPSNVVIQNGKTLIGSPYVALEVLPPSSYSLDLLRPKAMTPQSILLNCTGINCIHGDRIYHACDAYSNRIMSAQGITGNDIEQQNSVYTFRADDDFKISSIFPPASYMGKFSSPMAVSYIHTIEHHTPNYKSLKALSETYQIPRYSIPVISKRLALLPAVAKTLAAYKLNVTEGVTSLCTELRSTTDKARRPDSLDFGIYGQIYRWNPEYISEVINQMGVQDIRDLVATIGLEYIGSTPDVAWYYSRAIRAMYNFQPKTVKRLMNVDRFKTLSEGTYDFVEQETVLKVVTELGDLITRVGSKGFLGDIAMPNETIGPYEFYSMAGGLVFQGNRRFQINRFLIMDEMVADIKRNAARYDKIIGHSIADFWSSRRNYRWAFDFNPAPSTAVKGWYIEPHIWATSYLGIDDYSECKFEWLINFTISDIMLNILEDKYVTVYFASETMTTGGVKQSDVSTLQLHRNMFVRIGSYGYYQYKYNGANGIGDSERLFVWADGPVAVRSIKQNAISITKKRLSPMVTSQEVRGKEEW